jgi:hypothetical protein
MALLQYLRDNFDDNSRDTGLWNTGNVFGNANTGMTLAETNGRLEIGLAASASGFISDGYVSVTTWDLTNSWAAVRLVQKHADTGNAECYMALAITADNMIRIGTFDATFYIDQFVASDFASLFTEAYSATTHAWFRIRNEGGMLFFEVASSGANDPPSAWTVKWSMAAPFAITALTVYLSGGTEDGGASPGTVIWDGFNTSTTPKNRGNQYFLTHIAC